MQKECIEELTPVVMVGLRISESDEEFDHSMDELRSLCEACELEVVNEVTQTLLHPDNATWIGSGKAEELKLMVEMTGAEIAVCLGNLSPAQMKNLQKVIGIAVWDRTNLILEIFSRRAKTREARLQVESAYLQFMMLRLTGMWQHLGRQSGGGGSRANKGVGEKQIELDRRQISHRISELRKELEQIDKTRDVQRRGRSRDGLFNVSLVGYTNAGKSSLMNALLEMSGPETEKISEKKVFEENMLFATLDTSIRKIDIPGRKPFLLSDTVGFIENIPHDLIKAFRSTLSEVKFADVMLIVMDASDPHHRMHKKITEDTLKDLDVDGIPRLYVYNKADLCDKECVPSNVSGSGSVYLSTKTGYGMEDLLNELKRIFTEDNREIDVVVPYSKGDILNRIHNEAEVFLEKYEENGVRIKASCRKALAEYVNKRITETAV